MDDVLPMINNVSENKDCLILLLHTFFTMRTGVNFLTMKIGGLIYEMNGRDIIDYFICNKMTFLSYLRKIHKSIYAEKEYVMS